MAILLVDKSLKELRQVADNAVILARGETVWHSAIKDLSEAQTSRYLGV